METQGISTFNRKGRKEGAAFAMLSGRSEERGDLWISFHSF